MRLDDLFTVFRIDQARVRDPGDALRPIEFRPAEARDWAQRVLARKATIPRYLQRRERPWFRKAAALLKRLPSAPSAPSAPPGSGL